jgi:LexA-binding, inner membrane-associated putative hydrolase
MANFRRHMEVATISTGMLSSVCLSAGFINPYEGVALWIAGSLGGILPDIDSDNSSALDMVFSIFSLVGIFMMFSALYSKYSTLVLWGGCLLIIGLANFVIRPLFEKTTVHRGIFHSLIAGLFFASSAINLSYYVGNFSIIFSWLIGTFILLGFLIHLLLDELYSVDLSNARVKRSFGTAFKLFSYNNWKTSLLMTIAVSTVFYFSPSPATIYSAVTNEKTYLSIKQSFFPKS